MYFILQKKLFRKKNNFQLSHLFLRTANKMKLYFQIAT